MFTKAFLKRTAERAIKTFAQVFGTVAGLGEPGLSVLGLDWKAAAGLATAGALASLVTSIVSAPVGPAGSPSLVE